ncbi:Oidioi.mRNA.OKI2018_I69.PAR.g12180.t1.cds [Oikopleura dioica]|uniref:Oidioi.mRNA.OKI2018_I69.PAR.g12180.t1.cds n=1 Tax=Oikopleura dioica TaxID=34765 RepID=A0ABN7S2A1_OIKDI|nr:Oidioi.mRNA.OKI2018_I69.PAR.g12180.t1.cds [Oikopleura dioica]
MARTNPYEKEISKSLEIVVQQIENDNVDEPKLQIVEESDDEYEFEIITTEVAPIQCGSSLVIMDRKKDEPEKFSSIDFKQYLNPECSNIMTIKLWRPSPCPMPGSEVMNSKLEIRGFCCFLRRIITSLELKYIEMEEIALKFIEEQRKKKGHYSYDNSILLKKVILYEFQRPCKGHRFMLRKGKSVFETGKSTLPILGRQILICSKRNFRMLSPFLGVTSKAPEWRNSRIQEVYSDFVCDFIEAFLCKYLKSSEQQTIPFYDAIKLITSWRMSIKSQGSVKLTELAEEQVIEKALNHILGVHFLPDCVKKQKSLFFQYDDEERLITFTEDQPFSFQLLPADNSPDEKFPSPCDIPKELLEKLTFKMIKGEKERSYDLLNTKT